MREAIGSSWLIYLVITFILVYVFFIAFIMNYASAYRAANYVVTQIENCQGRMDTCNSMENIAKTVNTKYHYKFTNDVIDACYVQNINGTYVFRVNLPVSFELPMIGNLGVVNVRAETKSISRLNAVSNLSYYRKCS